LSGHNGPFEPPSMAVMMMMMMMMWLGRTYKGVSKSFQTGCLEQEPQMVLLSAC